jgi:hypothetical protein
MATVTPNFNWPVPTSTDLVKDGATAIEALGDSIDASLVDLKGGTTGQVLAKASGTDMDFNWVAQDDSNAIQNSIVDAKGDLIAASANDTPARLAVGANGETLVADSSTSTGLRYGANFAAGKNKIINGDFGVWQRGTSFTLTNGVGSYTADRFMVQCNFSSGSSTATQQTFTPGTAPVAGYESQFFLRITNSAGGTNTELQQRVEDVRTYAGQTVTISFWAKASSAVTMANTIIQNFGSGGSGTVSTTGTSQTLTTSWARYSTTINVPSVSGKTIGTSSYLQVYPMYYSSGTIASNVIDIWGVQIEAGSVATAFQTATGTLQGELAVCQRYYWRNTLQTATEIANVVGRSSTISDCIINFPVAMRTNPSAVEYGGTPSLTDPNVAAYTVTSFTFVHATSYTGFIRPNTASGLTQGKFYTLGITTNGYLGFSAEL